jgi:hypothetical protein
LTDIQSLDVSIFDTDEVGLVGKGGLKLLQMLTASQVGEYSHLSDGVITVAAQVV